MASRAPTNSRVSKAVERSRWALGGPTWGDSFIHLSSGRSSTRRYLLKVRKIMSAPHGIAYSLGHERQTPSGGVGASPPARRPTGPRGVLHGGGRRVPRHRRSLGSAVGRRISARGRATAPLPVLPGAAPQVDPDPGEDHPAVAGRQPDGAWLRHRAVDRPQAGPTRPGG